jgi:hypothetical protein
MRRISALFVLCAWLLASGAHWDFVQSLGWARMIVKYSQTMPVTDAVRLTFTADTLCGVCEFVADGKPRADATVPGSGASVPGAAVDSFSKGKLILATAPEYLYVFCSVPAPVWPTEHFLADAIARPAPPVEPPRAV